MNKYRSEEYITQRCGKSGWTFQVYIRTEDATITKSFSEKKFGSAKLAYETAIQFRDMCKQDILNHTVLRPMTITVREIFEDYIENSPDSYSTKNKHKKLFEKHIDTKDIPIQELTRSDIVSNLNNLTDKCSDDTIARVMSIYKNDIVEHAMYMDYISKDLMAGIRRPKSRMRKAKKSTVTDRNTILEVERLLMASQADSYNKRLIVLLMEVLYYTGMRPAEAEALTRNDIHDTCIDINKQLGSDRENNHVITKCKTPTSVRRVPIHEGLRPILEELLEYSDNEELFLKRDGRYLDSTYVGNIFRHLLDGTGLEFNLYMLRHNMATSLVTNGTDTKTTMELLGHAQYNMSLGYANSSDKLKKDAIKNFS